MHRIRLIREVTKPEGSGPINGQYALQKALRRAAPAWLKIGGTLRRGETPWFWCWEDRDTAAMAAAAGQPFIIGPNILFEDSRRPCRIPAERQLLNAASCRLMFTESEWYSELIEEYRGPENRAPIVLWPYPIDPKPGGPLPAGYDLLIYAKSGYRSGLIGRLSRRFKPFRLLRYGRFAREELFDAARRSRCCVYLSDDDRGPLALAEILLSGCPTVGVPTGAPFIQPGRTGVLLDSFCCGKSGAMPTLAWACSETLGKMRHAHASVGMAPIVNYLPQQTLDQFHLEECLEAIAKCHRLDRHTVAALAEEEFDTTRIVDVVLNSLQLI